MTTNDAAASKEGGTQDVGQFYVTDTDGWKRVALAHMNDPDSTGVLACALLTLIDAYNHAATAAPAQDVGRREPTEAESYRDHFRNYDVGPSDGD